MSIRVYNTLSRKKEDLVPREEGKISMYVCGPTVYNYIHIGNARTFLNFDIIRRYLEYAGFDVEFVENITDVDDKIINKANEEGIPPDQVAEKYRAAFEDDMDALGVKPPTVAPRATEHIVDMIRVIEGLIERGYAYEAGGDVYFEVPRFERYGALSGRTLEEQQAGMQCAVDAERKKNPSDFALWKASKPGEPYWESPWGAGRPGWHIECSTMSMEYLGDDFDIHGGGLDLVFPHHENEIAQAEAYSGKRFVRYWIHSGMLTLDKEKMSKSLGNIRLLREVLAEYDADSIRMLALGTHYKSPLSFGDNSLEEARASLDRIRNCLFSLQDNIGRRKEDRAKLAWTESESKLMRFLDDSQREFKEHMDDDFNSAAALGTIFEMVREINTYIDEITRFDTPASKLVLLDAHKALEELCGALGLFQGGAEESARRHVVTTRREYEKGPTAESLVELLLEVRQKAREDKHFELADRIRDGLAQLGIRVEDVPGGFRWKIED